jgi:hypothetical protein
MEMRGSDSRRIMETAFAESLPSTRKPASSIAIAARGDEERIMNGEEDGFNVEVSAVRVDVTVRVEVLEQ